MEALNYSIRIAAPREQVWADMLDVEKYRQWTKAFSENSQYVGAWAAGSHIRFVDPALGGTKALIEEFTPPSRVHAVHVATIAKDGTEDTSSEAAKKWIGVTETYTLSDADGATDLRVDIETHPDYAKMFNDCWPRALELLKALCERGWHAA